MDQSSIIRNYLQNELREFDTLFRESIISTNPRIQEIVDYVFKSDGKRIRPMLVFLSAKACGEINDVSFHGAVTIELLHTASLIHDDVVDNAKLRRGRSSVNDVYDNRRSILVGDYFLASALQESEKTKNFEIINMVSELGKNLAEGELNQHSLATEVIIDENEYFNVIDKKTASLMSACTKIGAISANVSRELVDTFSELGRIFGICFQIKDDIFDYYKTDVGKPTGNDIREGKITLPLIFALKNAPTNDSSEMLEIISKGAYTSMNIENLLQFAKDNGGISYSYDIMDKLINKGEEIISNIEIDKDIESMLILLFSYFRERAY